MITIKIDESKVCCPMCQTGPYKFVELKPKESFWRCIKCGTIFTHIHEGVETLND